MVTACVCVLWVCAILRLNVSWVQFSVGGGNEVVIVSACRTPIGSLGGALSSLTAPKLASVVVKAAVMRAGVKGEDIGEAIMGNVVSAGIGQSPTRQAVLFAGT